MQQSEIHSQGSMENSVVSTVLGDYLDQGPFRLDEYFAEAENISNAEVQARIEALVLHLAEMMQSGETPVLSLVSRRAGNVCESQGVLRLGATQQLRSLARSPAAFVRLWQVLGFAHQLLVQRKKATQRELYYCMLPTFNNQLALNHTVQEAVALLRVPRASLGIVAATRGFVAGSVLVQERDSGAWLDCSCGPLPIAGDPEALSGVRSAGARYVVVVEKQAVLARLCEDRVWARLPLVLLCGCGVPDLASRALAHRVSAVLRLPVLGLFDWNPGGAAVWAVWRGNSAQGGLEAFRYQLDVRWLGLHAADALALQLPASAYVPLSARDRKQLARLQALPWVSQHPPYARELALMESGPGKLELEALQARGVAELSRLVVNKILGRTYL